MKRYKIKCSSFPEVLGCVNAPGKSFENTSNAYIKLYGITVKLEGLLMPANSGRKL